MEVKESKAKYYSKYDEAFCKKKKQKTQNIAITEVQESKQQQKLNDKKLNEKYYNYQCGRARKTMIYYPTNLLL